MLSDIEMDDERLARRGSRIFESSKDSKAGRMRRQSKERGKCRIGKQKGWLKGWLYRRFREGARNQSVLSWWKDRLVCC